MFKRIMLAVVIVALRGDVAIAQVEPEPKGFEVTLTADLVILNASLWSGHEPPKRDEDPKERLRGVAIIGERIVGVDDQVGLQKYIGPNTKILNGRKGRIVPGFTDSHTHIVGGGLQLGRLNLRDVKSRDEFVAAVADAAKKTPKGEWVLGGRWTVESWANPQPPTREWLDPVSGDTPVLLDRMDGHQSLANSAALKLAGIDDKGPPDPVGGEIERDPKTKAPTGILKESAAELVSRLVPTVSAEQRYAALARAMRYANELGVTSVHDMSELDDLVVFRRADGEGTLTVRVTSYLSVSDWSAQFDRMKGYELDSPMVRLAGFKGYMDGSLGSRTAYMREPFADTHSALHPRGQLSEFSHDPSRFKEVVIAADGRGFQLALHAIGDEANHLALDAYEAAMSKNGKPKSGNRVEHVQHLIPDDIARFAKLGVVASMQPLHKADDGRYAEKALGNSRLAGSYAYRQLVDAGALVVFGSDWPVVSMSPMLGIDAAVNARTLSGEVWLPDHSLTLHEALTAYTLSPARAVGRDQELGTIEVGKLADLVVLGEDPFAVDRGKFGGVKVIYTIVGGKVVYDHRK